MFGFIINPIQEWWTGCNRFDPVCTQFGYTENQFWNELQDYGLGFPSTFSPMTSANRQLQEMGINPALATSVVLLIGGAVVAKMLFNTFRTQDPIEAAKRIIMGKVPPGLRVIIEGIFANLNTEIEEEVKKVPANEQKDLRANLKKRTTELLKAKVQNPETIAQLKEISAKQESTDEKKGEILNLFGLNKGTASTSTATNSTAPSPMYPGSTSSTNSSAPAI